MSTSYPTVPLVFERLCAEESQRRGRAFLDAVRRRRTVRDFSPEALPEGVLEDAIAAARAPDIARKPLEDVLVRV